MKNKSTVLRAVCILSSLALALVFILYRSGTWRLQQATSQPPVEVNEAPSETTESPVESEFFYGSKSGRIIELSPAAAEEFIGGSKSMLIIKPDDIRDGTSDEDTDSPPKP